jgi:hypothetical protein
MNNELPMRIVCTNDKNKPAEIPQNKWVKEGEFYTLIGVQPLLSSQSIGFQLAEITLDETCFPYHYFNPNRFEPVDEQAMEELENALEEILNPTVA